MTDCEHYFCGNCIHWRSDKGGKFLPCKRIDHDKIKFAKPWFKSYDANQFSGIICAEFYPKPWMKQAVENWKGFSEYWKQYVKTWLPYGNTNILVPFCLHDDTSVRYGVPLMDFVNGTMVDGNTLKAIEKTYYKRSAQSPAGYVLVRDRIDGVEF